MAIAKITIKNNDTMEKVSIFFISLNPYFARAFAQAKSARRAD
jgi:hypothetical protein